MRCKLCISFVACCLLLCLGGCEGRRPAAARELVTVTDDLGRQLQVPRLPRRVLGLAPSATEMLFAVADTGQVVGRSQACNYPAAALTKPVVNTYPLDYEQLVLLQPDLVVTLAGMTPPEAADRLAQLDIPVYYQRLETVEDIFQGLYNLGRLLNQSRRARQVVDSLRQELHQLQQQVAARPRSGPRPRVLAITWSDPIYVHGRNTLLTDKLRWIGAENALTDTFAQPFPALTREYILQLNPDVVLGGSFTRMDTTFFRLYPELRQIKAYRHQQLFPVTDDLMTRPGPRVVAAIRELYELIH